MGAGFKTSDLPPPNRVLHRPRRGGPSLHLPSRDRVGATSPHAAVSSQLRIPSLTPSQSSRSDPTSAAASSCAFQFCHRQDPQQGVSFTSRPNVSAINELSRVSPVRIQDGCSPDTSPWRRPDLARPQPLTTHGATRCLEQGPACGRVTQEFSNAPAPLRLTSSERARHSRDNDCRRAASGSIVRDRRLSPFTHFID